MSKNELKKLQQQLVTASDSNLLASTVRFADEYLAISPGSVKALIDKAHALAGLSRYDDSLNVYQEAIEALQDGQSPDAIYGEIGNLYRTKGDFIKAIEYYRKQIESDPDDATGYLFLGTLQLQQGDIAAAQETLESANHCTGGCLEELKLALGNTMRAKGDYEQAAACYTEALQISPGDALAKAALKDVRQAAAGGN
jgi:tetratricopeptide (TPR) repeat protein